MKTAGVMRTVVAAVLAVTLVAAIAAPVHGHAIADGSRCPSCALRHDMIAAPATAVAVTGPPDKSRREVPAPPSATHAGTPPLENAPKNGPPAPSLG
jgi:hypothetical protein